MALQQAIPQKPQAVIAQADFGATAAKANYVRIPTFQPTKMLRDARMATSTGRIAAS